MRAAGTFQECNSPKGGYSSAGMFAKLVQTAKTPIITETQNRRAAALAGAGAAAPLEKGVAVHMLSRVKVVKVTVNRFRFAQAHLRFFSLKNTGSEVN